MRGKDIAISHRNLERKFLKKQEAFYNAKKEMEAAKIELTKFDVRYGSAVKLMKNAEEEPTFLAKLLGG